MKKIFNCFKFCIALAAAAASMQACLDFQEEPQEGAPVLKYSVSMAGTQTVMSRGAVPETAPAPSPILFENEEEGFCGLTLSSSVEVEGSAATRSSASLLNAYSDLCSSAGEFTVSAYRNDKAWFENETVSYNESLSQWQPRGEHLWYRDNEYKFYAYANLPDQQSSATFSKNGVSLDYVAPDEVFSQTDVLMGYYKGKGESGVAPLTFSHALSSLSLKAGTLTDVALIKSIDIQGFYKKGMCTFSDGNVDWTHKSGDLSFTAYISTPPAEGDMLFGPILVIPQDSQEKEIRITLKYISSIDNTEKIAVATISSGTFIPGRTTVYTLSYSAAKLDVTVNNIVSGNTINNLEFVNAGNQKEYIRAAVTGNWYDDSGDILEGWSIESSDVSGFPGAGWSKGSDGFYYYADGVPAGGSPSALFTSLTKPEDTEGRHLEVKIHVQSVKYSFLFSCEEAFNN